MMGLAGFVSIHSLTPLAVFFCIVGLTVIAMVGKLLQHLQVPAVPGRCQSDHQKNPDTGATAMGIRCSHRH
jgi:DHA1 family 2-module integral membrane pump EmrD-like MFS transporter